MIGLFQMVMRRAVCLATGCGYAVRGMGRCRLLILILVLSTGVT